MVSFWALQSYNPFLNLLIGIIYFIGVTQLGRLLLKLFLPNLPDPFRNVLAVLLGFLVMSATMNFLSICFWINRVTIYTTNGIVFFLFLLTGYQKIPSCYSYLKKLKFNYAKPTLLSGLVFVLTILPILYYVLLPTTKIDDLHYHMPPVQYISMEGGYTYPHQYLRNPAFMIYSMAQIPIVYFGFPDSASVISLLFWLVIVYFSHQILRKFDLTIRLLAGAILIVGLYSIVQATPSSTVFSSLSVVLLVVLFAERDLIIKHSSLNNFCWAWAIAANAAAIGKISLVILTVFLSLVVLYDIMRHRKASWHILFAFLLPTMIFYLPTLVWTYAHVGTFWGPIMADIFPYHKFSPEEIRIAKTMPLKNMNEVTINIMKYNLINFSLIKLLAIIFLFFSTISKKIKIDLLVACLSTAVCFQYLGNAVELRYWGSIDNAFFILTLLYIPTSWKLQLQRPKTQLAIIALGVLPYLSTMYYYITNLNPIPFFNEEAKKTFFSKFVPYYADYQALNKVLPKNAVLFFPEGNVNIVYAPRKLYVYTKDIHQDSLLYIITSSLQKQPQHHTIQAQQYEKGEKIYENQNSYARTYRTPNQARKTAILEVHKLQKIKLLP